MESVSLDVNRHPKGASTGARPRVPVGFGMYECGRAGYNQKSRTYAWCRSGQPQGVPVNVPPQMDPGQYTPYRDFGESDAMRSQSRQRRPFDSTEIRELAVRFFGKDAPPAIYNNVHGQYDYAYYKNSGGSRNSFRSTSLQRPQPRSDVPAPNAYSPNQNAIHADVASSGGMRGASDRFGNFRGGMGGQKCQTDVINGPGTYEQNHGTLMDDCKFEIRRMSKVKAPFGTTTPQRALPTYNRDASPDIGPGAYEPIVPRTRDRLRMLSKAHSTGATRVQVAV